MLLRRRCKTGWSRGEAVLNCSGHGVLEADLTEVLTSPVGSVLVVNLVSCGRTVRAADTRLDQILTCSLYDAQVWLDDESLKTS